MKKRGCKSNIMKLEKYRGGAKLLKNLNCKNVNLFLQKFNFQESLEFFEKL